MENNLREMEYEYPAIYHSNVSKLRKVKVSFTSSPNIVHPSPHYQ